MSYLGTLRCTAAVRVVAVDPAVVVVVLVVIAALTLRYEIVFALPGFFVTVVLGAGIVVLAVLFFPTLALALITHIVQGTGIPIIAGLLREFFPGTHTIYTLVLCTLVLVVAVFGC